MKITKKTLVSLLVLIFSVSIILSGCGKSTSSSSTATDSGSKSDSTAKADSGSSKGKTEIVWLVRTDPNMIKWEKEMITQFEEKNPNISVKLETIPQDQIDQRLTTMIASGNVPDVWSSNWANSGFATYRKMGALLDLTPYIQTDQDATKGISQKIMDIYKIDGKTYGMPMLAIGSFVFYNKDLFDKAGLAYPPTDWDDTSWTWDKMLQDAQKLTNNSGDQKTQVWGLLDNNATNIQTWEFGGDLFSKEAYQTGDMGEPQVLTNPINKEALQAEVDLIQKYKVSPNRSQLDAVNQIGDPFMTGKVAMVKNGGWGFWVYGSAKFHWGVAAMPYVEGRKAALYVDPWNISAKSKHPDESWKLIKFLTDPNAGGKAFMKVTNATPANDTLLEDWYNQMSGVTGMTVDQIKQVNEGAIKYGREADNHLIDKFSTINNTISQTMTSVYNGKTSVEDGLKEIDKNLRSLNLK